MKKKLTKRILDALSTPEVGGRTHLFDTVLPGFGAVKHPTGRVTFFVQYGGKDQRRVAIGRHGPLTVDQAREEARRRLGDVARGGDPLEERKAAQAIPTFSKWIKGYLEDVGRRKKSAGDDRRYLKWVEKKWGRRRLDKITTEHVSRAFEERREKHGKISANRFLASVRACLTAAWRIGHVMENVAARVKLLPENPPRQRVLSDEELHRVVKEIVKLKDPHLRVAFELLLSTGARKSEVLRARWEDMDLEAALWSIPAPKSGEPQTAPLPRTTVALLKNTPQVGPWIVPGRWPERHREDLRGPWKDIRKNANVEDVTIHDVRRTYGLHAARTAGLHVASKLLRHSTVRITERVYAPLGIEELQAATEKVASGRKAKVLELSKRDNGNQSDSKGKEQK